MFGFAMVAADSSPVRCVVRKAMAPHLGILTVAAVGVILFASAGRSSTLFVRPPALRGTVALHASAPASPASPAAKPRPPQRPPGPWALPILGSVSLLWGLLRGVPLPDLLKQYRQKYGKIFMLQTGPVRQVWIGDPEVLRRVYECPECSGRPARYEDPFGNFLFLTREASAAAPIKEQQQAWLSANIRADAISLATDDAMEQLFPVLDGGGSVPWPADKVRTAMYSAVTRAILGDDAVLSSEELEELMSATREYSEMKRKSSARDSRLPPGAAEIKRIVGGALQRVGRADADQALPLIAAATIGGAEIFPTLLHWIFLKLAQHTEVLEAATEAALARDDAALMKTSYLVLRQTPYSVALGPPRRVMADVEVDGLQLPEGALLFAMHPALAGDTFAREDPDDFASYAFGVGSRACLGQKLTEALLPAAVGALLRRYKVVGLGAGPVRGVMKGQLIRPHDPPALVWERRG